MKTHTINVNERELRVILHAFDLARDPALNTAWRWWTTTRYVDRLYYRLREHDLGAKVAP
jgi:hypothetical protein